MIPQNLTDTVVLQEPDAECQGILQCRAEVSLGYLLDGGDRDQSQCRELGSYTALGYPNWTAEIRMVWDISPEVTLLPLKHLRKAIISWNALQIL